MLLKADVRCQMANANANANANAMAMAMAMAMAIAMKLKLMVLLYIHHLSTCWENGKTYATGHGNILPKNQQHSLPSCHQQTTNGTHTHNKA